MVTRSLTNEDLELAVQWTGPTSLVEALAEFGFLDGQPGEYRIHDWAFHQPFVATRTQRVERARANAKRRWENTTPEERSSQARAAAQSRWTKEHASDQHAQSTHGDDASDEHASGTHADATDIPADSTHATQMHATSTHDASEMRATRKQNACSPRTPRHARTDDDDHQRDDCGKSDKHQKLKSEYLAECEDPAGQIALAIDIILERAEASGSLIRSRHYFDSAVSAFFANDADRELLQQQLRRINRIGRKD